MLKGGVIMDVTTPEQAKIASGMRSYGIENSGRYQSAGGVSRNE